MPPTRSDRKRIVRDEDDLPANGSSSPNSPAGGTAMSRRGTAHSSSSASSPKAHTNAQHMSQLAASKQQQQAGQKPAARSTNPFHITPEQLMQQYQMLTEPQKAVLATYSPADQKKLLEQQVAKRIYEKMSPTEQAMARARAQQAHQQNQARGQVNGSLGSRVFFFSETPEALLKKFENEPPSLVLHIHPSHFRFGNQESVIPKDSPIMKMFLEYVAYKAIPPAATEVFGDSALRFYEGNIILQIVDHRAVPQEHDTDLTTQGDNKNKTDQNSDSSNENSDTKPKTDGIKKDANSGSSGSANENENKDNKDNTDTSNSDKNPSAEPKIVRTILRPTPLSMWHDLLYTSDFQANPLSDDVALGVESEILRFTIRNLDLTVPKNPYSESIAPILTNQADVRNRAMKEQGKRTWSELQTEQIRLREVSKKIKKEEEAKLKKEPSPVGQVSYISGIIPSADSVTDTKNATQLTPAEEALAIKVAASQAQDSAFEKEDKAEREELRESILFDNDKEASEKLYKNRKEIDVKPRKLHEELMQHGSEYEDLMLVMSEKPPKPGSNSSSGQLVRLSFIEQIYKKNKNHQRFKQLRQAQVQAASGQATAATATAAPVGVPSNVQNPTAIRTPQQQPLINAGATQAVTNNVLVAANNANNSNLASGGNAAARPRVQPNLLRQQQLQLQFQQIRAQFPQLTQAQALELLRRRQAELQQKQMEAARAHQQSAAQNQGQLQQDMQIPNVNQPRVNSPIINQNQLNNANNMINSDGASEMVSAAMTDMNAHQDNTGKGMAGSPAGSLSGTPVMSSNVLYNHNRVAGKSIPGRQMRNNSHHGMASGKTIPGAGGSQSPSQNSHLASAGKTIPGRQNSMGNMNGNANMNGGNTGVNANSNMAQFNGDLSGVSFGNMGFANMNGNNNNMANNIGINMNNIGVSSNNNAMNINLDNLVNLNNLNGLNMDNMATNDLNNMGNISNDAAMKMRLGMDHQTVGGKAVPAGMGRASGKTIPGANPDRQNAGNSLSGLGMG